MRTRVAFIMGLIAFAPALASAAAFGFPREPLWVSSTSVQEGEAVTMYVAVYNSSDTELKGSVSFLADGTIFDTKEVSLVPGSSSLLTDSWESAKGTHSLSAQFISSTQKDTTQKISVTVTAAPPAPPATPTATDQAVSTATDFAKGLTASDSPVTKVAHAVMGTTEKVRAAGANAVRPYASDAPAKSSGSTLAVQKPASTSYVHKATQLAAAAALYAFDTKWLFYVLLILLLYYIARTVKRWATGPRF